MLFRSPFSLRALQLSLSLHDDDEGQDLVEYALLLGLIAIVAVLAITSAGTSVNTLFSSAADKVSTALPK